MPHRITRFFLLLAAALALVSLNIFAQQTTTPDLSGTWVLNAANSKVPKKVALAAETLVIKSAGDKIEIAIFFGDKQSVEVFVVDGKERTKDTGSGGEIYSKAHWKKAVLFTEIGGRVTGNGIGTFDVISHKEHWSVSPDGQVLKREVEDPKETLIYDKRPVS